MTSICFYTPHYFYLYYRDLKGFFWVKLRCCNSAELSFTLVKFRRLCLGGIFDDLSTLVECLTILPW